MKFLSVTLTCSFTSSLTLDIRTAIGFFLSRAGRAFGGPAGKLKEYGRILKMALTNDDKEWAKMAAKLISNEAIKNFSEKIFTQTETTIAAHIASCPHGKRLMKYVWLMVGVGVGCGALGSGLGSALIKIITG